ncbi:MAG: hypothetical protein GY930_09120 [bacterium]|nr:hypothetical protein [bacterium]
MNLEFLSPLGFAGGLAVLAGALYMLHRLRVRHREVIVPTTLFWKQAQEDTLARKLTAVFRHPRAYLFVLAILALLLLAIAGPSLNSNDDTDYVILLDGSADMARGDCLEEAVEITGALLDELPRTHTTLVYANATPSTLLAAEESSLLFESRSQTLKPSAAPETITAELLRLARESRSSKKKTAVYIVGEALLSGDLKAELMQTSEGLLAIQRVSKTAKVPADNFEDFDIQIVAGSLPDTRKPANIWDYAILGFGMAPSASGQWGSVDLWIETSNEEAPTIEGIDSAQVESAIGEDNGHPWGWWVRDLPLDGLPRSLVAITGDGPPHPNRLALDNRAEILMPTGRGAIGAWLGDSVPPAFAAAVAADPGLFLSAKADAAIAIGSAEDLAGVSMDTASWTLAARSDLQASVVGTSEGPSFASIFHSLDLASIERTQGKAEQASDTPPISLSEQAGALALATDVALFSAPYELIESRSFPLLVGFAARWLAGTETIMPFAAAGKALPLGYTGGMTADSGTNFATAGTASIPPTAGQFEGAIASLLSPVTSGSTYPAGMLKSQSGSAFGVVTIDDIKGGGQSLLPTLLLLLALLLLVIEWYVFRTGRMP